MNRIYQNEKVLMREVGLLKTIELTKVKHEKSIFEGTEKEIDAEVKRLLKQPNVNGVFGEYR